MAVISLRRWDDFADEERTNNWEPTATYHEKLEENETQDAQPEIQEIGYGKEMLKIFGTIVFCSIVLLFTYVLAHSILLTLQFVVALLLIPYVRGLNKEQTIEETTAEPDCPICMGIEFALVDELTEMEEAGEITSEESNTIMSILDDYYPSSGFCCEDGFTLKMKKYHIEQFQEQWEEERRKYIEENGQISHKEFTREDGTIDIELAYKHFKGDIPYDAFNDDTPKEWLVKLDKAVFNYRKKNDPQLIQKRHEKAVLLWKCKGLAKECYEKAVERAKEDKENVRQIVRKDDSNDNGNKFVETVTDFIFIYIFAGFLINFFIN
jgi:hypothetical protein